MPMAARPTLYLKPTHSRRLERALIVRQPEREGAPLAEDGAWVPRNAYWLRRLREGSVEEAREPNKAPAKKRRADTTASGE